MFKPARVEKRKALIAEINRDVKTTFEETFAESYQNVREQLIQGGVSEEKVDAKLSQIKAKLEQKMIISAQKLLREAVLEVAREEMADNKKECIDEPQSMDPPKKTGVSFT